MIESIKDLTYMVRHSPNCPKPFEVRLSGGGLLDQYSRRAYMRTRRDFVGYGMTAEEAAAEALAQKALPAWGREFRQIWDGL